MRVSSDDAQTGGNKDAEDSLDAVDARTPVDDDSHAGGDEPPAPARFALYDAFEEAEHW
ncbi:hypothetical protein [Streptomyces sp. NBC_00328]|uniref:hypothetical protein n=1 Tax=Streptomyces sp. NBC_00328 TaxID=2903646 RepID=UPI002E2DA47C|nr:hypothetical protein [Streptomyces sp. NBC_00328]